MCSGMRVCCGIVVLVVDKEKKRVSSVSWHSRQRLLIALSDRWADVPEISEALSPSLDAHDACRILVLKLL